MRRQILVALVIVAAVGSTAGMVMLGYQWWAPVWPLLAIVNVLVWNRNVRMIERWETLSDSQRKTADSWRRAAESWHTIAQSRDKFTLIPFCQKGE